MSLDKSSLFSAVQTVWGSPASTESLPCAVTREIVERIGDAKSVDDLNTWIQLAMNIWNNTPQPYRGGKTAHDLLRQRAGKG